MGKLRSFFTSKLKASSLTEVIVATTILMIVFAIALTTLNNTLLSSARKNTLGIEKQLNELMYTYTNNPFKTPLTVDAENWKINIQKVSENDVNFIVFEANNILLQKKIIKKLIALEDEKN